MQIINLLRYKKGFKLSALPKRCILSRNFAYSIFNRSPVLNNQEVYKNGRLLQFFENISLFEFQKFKINQIFDSYLAFFNQSSNQNNQKNEFEKNDENLNKQNNNQDDEKRKMQVLMLAITLIASFLLISMSSKQIEDLKNVIKEKDRQLLEKKAKSNSSDMKTNNENRLILKNGNLITWDQFFQNVLTTKKASQLFAKRNDSLVIVKLKEPIEQDGMKIYFLFMHVPPEQLENKLEKAQDDLNLKLDERIFIEFKDNSFISNTINILIFGFFAYLIFRGFKVLLSKVQSAQTDFFSQFTKPKFQVVDPHLKAGVPQVTFKEVAGLHEAKIEIKEFVDYLRQPERFKKLGARVPKGALLLGPPGCGKTLLAKAVASEANVPFFNIAGTEFVEVIGGLGASRVRSLFDEARKQSPSIIYIDEIDAIGRKRSDSNQAGSSGEADQTLNQLLVSMDGLESNSNVVVLASTNRADILDKALLRPGRLDRHINIDLPNYDERIEILNVHMKNLKIDFIGKEKDEFVSELSHLTPRFSGADLANICNESALLAARHGLNVIKKNYFHMALERVIAGAEKKNVTMTVEDRKMIAYHECGHLLVSWLHSNSDLILKVSLLSRTKMNAFSQYLTADRKLYSKEDLFDQMCLHFGGRVAESIVFNKFTTSAENDLKKITKLAYAQVESFGMNDVIGNLSFPTQQEEKSSGMVGKKPYSKKLRNTIDLEVNKLVSNAHDQAIKTIKNNIDKLHLLAEELLKRENLNFEDIVQLIGQPINSTRYKK